MFANDKHEEAYNLAKAGSLNEALVLFNEAMKITPSNPDLYSDRGVLFIHLKDKSRALKDFHKAVELQPDYSFRYSARAYAFDFFGDTESAVKDYEKAVELDPTDSVAYNNLGLVQEKLGYQAKAKSNFERADKLAKQEAKLHQLMNDLEQSNTSEETKPSEKEKEPGDENAPKNENRETLVPVEKKDSKQSAFSEFSKLFTSKEQFNAFLKFLKNGFKIK